MDKIPVKFTYNAKEYNGVLSSVSGAGSSGLWHLYVGNFYQGQLFNTDKGWQFCSQQGKGNELSEYFGRTVEMHT